MSNQAYPLDWPIGWPRATRRTDGLFRVGGGKAGQSGARRVELDDGLDRVFDTLKKMGVKEDNVTVSSNVKPRLGSRAGAISVQDPGVCVYWTKGTEKRCMAIDQYTRVPDNLAAIAATLEAMRAIERYGGAEILERAFTGFNALPAPEQPWQVLGVGAHASKEEIERAYRLLASEHHPDKGGDSDTMAKLNWARDTLLENRP